MTTPSDMVRRLARRLRQTPAALVVVLVIGVVHALAWVAVQPPLTGPDEDLHAAYVQSLAETGGAPSYDSGSGTRSSEITTLADELYLTPILLHPEARPAWGRVGEAERRLRDLPASARKDTSGPNTAAANPPLYYLGAFAAWELWPDRSLGGRLLGTRLASASLMPIIVLLAWLLAAEVFAAPALRPLVAGIVALNPKLASSAAAINPDMLLATLATGCLLAALRVVRRGPSTGRVAALALTAAGAVLTHGRGLYLLVFAGLVLAFSLWTHRPERRRALLLAAGAGGVMVFAAAGAFAWTQSHAEGATLAGAAPSGGGFNLREFVSYVWQFYLPGIGFAETDVGAGYGYRQVFISTFFGAFASLDVHFSEQTYERIRAAVFLGLIAIYTTALLRRDRLRARWPIVAVCVIAFLGLVAELHVVSYTSLRGGGNPVITGRYLLPAIGLLGLVVAFVVNGARGRARAILAGGALGLAALHALASLGIAVERFYA